MPEEIWVAKIISLKEGSWDKVLLDFLKPIIVSAETENLLSTFHFFFEPNGLHFRIRLKEPEKTERIKEIIDQNARKVKDLVEIRPTTYFEEQKNYGVEGWACAQKFFEFGCRFSLLKLETRSKYLAETDPKKRKGILESCRIDQEGDFNESKFIHCFLNQTGRGYAEEALFHQQRIVQSLLNNIQVLYKGLDERLKKIEGQRERKGQKFLDKNLE